MNPTAELIQELNTLLRLTQTEAGIARTRVAQAKDDRTRRELEENSKHSEERSRLLGQAIRDLGGAPDVLGAAVGRLGAAAKFSFEQAQPLSEALLGDLALEHQLLDRTRFARMLAETLGETKVVPVLERLELAHNATVEWIHVRLGELAAGGPVAIVPSPPQVALQFARRLAVIPNRQFAQLVNRSFETAKNLRNRAGRTVESNVDRARQLADAAGEVVTATRNTALERTEKVASAYGADRTADAVADVRENLGVVDAGSLPIPNYDNLTNAEVIRRIKALDSTDDVQLIMAYEGAHKNRKPVVTAADQRFEELARELANV